MIDYQVEDTINEALKNCDFFLSKYGQNEDKKLFNLFKNCESLLINLLTSDKNQKVKFFLDLNFNYLNNIFRMKFLQALLIFYLIN